MCIVRLSLLSTSQSAGSSHKYLISMDTGVIGQLLKTILPLLVSFPFSRMCKKIFFLFEKPTKSLIVIVSKSLIKQPTDRYSSVPSLTKCRFLHNYQCTKNNVDRIWPHPSTNQKGQVKSQHCPSETVCSVSLYKSLYHRPMIRFTDSLVILDTKYICCEQ